jgi:3-oxoadipate enol-lactonase
MPFATVEDCRIHYRFDGPEDAPIVMLSHSIGTHMGMWAAQLPAFTKRFRLLRYDGRGEGLSDVVPGPYTMERLGRDAVGLLDVLGLREVRFCGLSMGGMVGMWLAVNAPDRVERLALCNTAALMQPANLWDERIQTVRSGGMAAIAESVLARWFTGGFRQTAPERVEPIRRMLLDTPPEGYMACCVALRDMDQSESIRAIRRPVLVVVGAHDPATTPAQGRLIADRILGASYLSLDAAHLSNVEARAPFDAAVGDFLAM